MRLPTVAGLVCAVAMVAPTRAQEPPRLADLLRTAASYLTEYEQQISAVVSEETYVQTQRGSIEPGMPSLRTLKSDVLVINGGQAGWFGFRDVYDVDGRAVRDHADRLLRLVTQPAPDSFVQAKRMMDEGARFNLGIVRTLNMPTIALRFLRQGEQDRSTWTFGGEKKIDGRQVAELRFTEQATPRGIVTLDNAPARGRFWIEPNSGRLVRWELVLESMDMRATVTVTFGPAPKITPWVPALMEEQYQSIGTKAWTALSEVTPRGMVVEGRATYRNFRAFSVDTTTIIK